jgi:hypothetical protein
MFEIEHLRVESAFPQDGMSQQESKLSCVILPHNSTNFTFHISLNYAEAVK